MNVEERIISMLDGLIIAVSQIQAEFVQMKTETYSRFDKLEQGQADLYSRFDKLEQGQSDLRTDIVAIKLIIESEINKDIRLLAEGYKALNDKLDKLSDLNEQVIKLKTDTAVLKSVAREAFRVVKNS